MNKLIAALVAGTFATAAFAAEPAKKEEKKDAKPAAAAKKDDKKPAEAKK